MVVQIGPVPATNEQSAVKQNLAIQQLFSAVTALQAQTPIPIPALTFATLPGSPITGAIAYITDGLAANCADTSCTTFGTNVTGGTGALKLLLWYNGTHWTLIGK